MKPSVVRLGDHQRSQQVMDCDIQGLCDLTFQDVNVTHVVVHKDFQGKLHVKRITLKSLD